MIKVEASKDEYGDYDEKEVLEIIRKGFEAGETEFSTPLSGYGNWKMGGEYKIDSNTSAPYRQALRDDHISALLWVLTQLIPYVNDPDFGKYTPLEVDEFSYDDQTDMFTFKVYPTDLIRWDNYYSMYHVI